MAHFLWVEDFPGDNSTRSTTEALFGHYLSNFGVLNNDLAEEPRLLKDQLKPYGIYIETNFYDGYRFIHNHLNKVDFIVLDIDLPCDDGYLEDYEFNEIVGRLIEWEYLNDAYYNNEIEINIAQANFKKIAGYHLYTELVINIGFPKENIIFCSNHGEELKTITEAFEHAKLGKPRIYKKSEINELHPLVQRKNDIPYFNLRRGMLMASDYYKPDLEKNKHVTRFSQQWNLEQGTYKNAYFSNYLSLLEMILPMREPKDKKHSYKLLLRTIVHNWDQTTEKIDKRENKYWFVLVKILNHCRNWTAHNRKAFDTLSETFLAFIFLVHMRATYQGKKILTDYEKQLLPLFGQPMDSNALEQELEAIPDVLSHIYQGVLDMADKNNGFYDNLINQLQQDTTFVPPYGNYDTFFQTALYRMLWFVLLQNSEENRFSRLRLNPEQSDLEFFIYTLEHYIYSLGFPDQ